MTHEEAARILDPETSRDALCEIEYYGGFRGEEARLEACNEACRMAAKVLREPRAVRLDDTGAQAMALAAEVSELRQELEEAEARVKKLSEALEMETRRAAEAEGQRDAAIFAINNAYRSGAITVNDPKFIIPGVKISGWHRTVKEE